MSEDSKPPPSKRRRLMRFAGMTASVAGGVAKRKARGIFQNAEARARDNRAQDAKNGARIAKTLGELKGAAMKLGQFASTAHGLLPEELVAALGGLQGNAPAVPFATIRAQVESEFGAPLETLFAHFDHEPFAAASIGQVHRARTDDGREVVCKVQYPGVDGNVDADIRNLKLVLRASGMLGVRRHALDAVFAEVRERLLEEIDYTNEATNVRWFRRLHADDPHMVIPDVVGERSSGRVLTLTYEPGDALTDLDAAGYTQATRNLVGERVAHMMFKQLYQLHAVHADPNPANFACRPNGDLVVYDFGCIKIVPPQLIADYRQFILALQREDYAGVDDGLLRVGARIPGTPPPPRPFYEELRSSLSPFLPSDAPLDFTTSTSHIEFTNVLRKALRHTGKLQPSSLMTFIDRMQTGQHQNLMELRAVIDFSGIFFSYLGLPQLGEPGYEERMKAVPAR